MNIINNIRQHSNNLVKVLKVFTVSVAAMLFVGCAAESHQSFAVKKVASYGTQYQGKRETIVIGNFQNSSSYLRGLFSTVNDRLGNQAKTILKTHLQQTNRFNLVDRDNMSEIKQEAELLGIKQQLAGAHYAITGSVTEFGRKEIGDKQLFGILGSGKKQIAYAKVSLNIVDVLTSTVVYSTQSAGEYVLSQREVLGFGQTASYDSTLNGKVLNLAITEAVNNLVRDLESGHWSVKK